MVWMAFIIFILGTVYQVVHIFFLLKDHTLPQLTPGPGNIIPTRAGLQEKTDWLLWLKLSIAGVNPFMTLLTSVFHLILMGLPWFVLGHNILLDNAFGISLVSLPEGVSDILTLVVIVCAGLFFARRLFLQRVRIITTIGDHLFLLLVTAPFITGYLAYHQILGDYKVMLPLHILSGGLMLMAIPFTKSVHMIYFVIVRFYVSSEYALGKGKKVW